MRRHLLALLCCLLPLSATAETPWQVTWTASPQAPWSGAFPLPVNVPERLWQQTLRQNARISVGGHHVRVMLSNEYGTQPLVIGAAHLARTADGATIVAGSDRVLRFGGKTTAIIPPGAPLISDPVDLDVAALDTLSISLYLPQPTPTTTLHWDARQTAYIGGGDQTAATAFKTDTQLQSRLFVRDVIVDAAPSARTVVAFGDSITDGNASTPDANHRWPDFLAARLASDNIAVLNAGISGARLLHDRMGVNALARFERDVLSQPNVRTVVVLMGINDIAWPGHVFAPDESPVQADAVIDAYRQLIAQTHLRGVRIVGATLTPFENALAGTPLEGYYRPDRERIRQEVNRWIRSSGAFDAVVDFDALLRDAQHPQRMQARYDSGDHLHPGDAGYAAMADALTAQLLFGS